MKYEVLTIKKHFRYHATVMATPDKWWEKYLLFKRTTTMQFHGHRECWVDPTTYDFAPDHIQELIDAKFDEQFRVFSGINVFLNLLFNAVFRKR
jgi:hypothetical protein